MTNGFKSHVNRLAPPTVLDIRVQYMKIFYSLVVAVMA